MTGTTRSALRFRNLDVSPDDAVERWPFEGVLAALERGTLPDWRRLIAAIDADPWGTVARAVEEAQQLELPYGVAALFAEAIAEARARAAEDERREVAAEIRALLERSGLSRAAFAERIGTSVPRLSTYLSGKVTPSAALVVRMRRVAAKARCLVYRYASDRPATRVRSFLEHEVWPEVPRAERGKRLTRREEDELLGYGESGA